MCIIHQTLRGGRAPPGPAGELKRFPNPLAATRGSYFEGEQRGKAGREMRKEGKGRERKGRSDGADAPTLLVCTTPLAVKMRR